MWAMMRNTLLNWVISAVAMLITAYVVPGFKVAGFGAAMIAALVVAVANATLWYVLMVLTLPLNVLTLGLFTFIVNGIVIKICAAIVPGFAVDTWFAAIIGAIVMSLSAILLHTVLRA